MGRKKKSRNRKPKTLNETRLPPAVSSSSAPAPEAPSSAVPPSPAWIELPEDVTANILQRLGAEEILETAQKVCTTWKKVCLNPTMWRAVDLCNRFGLDFSAMCRCAVDRSQGQLTDLSIAYFGEDELLKYVADRSSRLRRLNLYKPYEITASALVEAVKKLPQLEELYLFKTWPLDPKEVEAIGISCPLLKSFRYYADGAALSFDEIGIPLAIAKTMPNLHHLRLFQGAIRDEGVEAILDGCPHLESLDLSDCFRVYISDALEERCSKQRKVLRFPETSDDDFD